MNPRPSPHLLVLARIALDAGREIMAVYARGATAREKADLTPVTEADELAERTILAGLSATDAATPVVSEEAASCGRIPKVGQRFYLVDPLDGTREFLSRNGEFTVNIALVESGVPTAGLVYAPASERIFAGSAGDGAWAAKADGSAPADALDWEPAQARNCQARAPVIVASRSHLDEETKAWLDTQGEHTLVSAGSSLKFCLLAEGKADLYPRFGRTMEWDTAAGHAVLSAAGGRVEATTGEPLRYGKADQGFANPGFIARGPA
jgi:3'(2'), 5'-bisphosphate nucleotidase